MVVIKWKGGGMYGRTGQTQRDWVMMHYPLSSDSRAVMRGAVLGFYFFPKAISNYCFMYRALM